MQTLKFLGKPAPKAFIIDGVINSRIRAMHLEGAIKEADFMLVTFRKKWPKEIWKEWDAWLDTQPRLLTAKYGSYEKHFVAFLLRKTIGERT